MMLVRLFRDSFNTPWGFRLQGGKDLNQELVVQRVFSNSPAERELQRGDVILSINGRDASGLTHKQALEGIKHGGGQIELCVRRPPPGRSDIKPLQPTSPTRAPTLFTPLKTPSALLPVRRSSDHSPKSMPAPHMIAGHQPKKVTMNKFGGGTTHFGTNFGARAMQPGWVPQPSPYSQQYTPQSSMGDHVDSGPAMQYAPQAPQQHYQPAPQSPQYQVYAMNQPQQFQEQPQHRQPPPPQSQPQQYTSPGLSQPDYVRSEDPVEEEEYDYVPVTQRKKAFAGQQPKEPATVSEDEDYYYPKCPVWERRRLFMKDQPKVVRAGKKKVIKTSGYTPFGTDYSKPQAPQPIQQQQRPRPPPPPVERPVNAAPHDEPDTSSTSVAWSSTLRSSGGPRPWEQESKDYVMPSQREATQQAPKKQPPPAISPKPPRSHHQAQQKESPQPQITIRSVPNEPLQDAAQDGARVVHLQYNSPMGLYSNENVQQTYAGQIQGSNKTSSTVSKPAQQTAPVDENKEIDEKNDKIVENKISNDLAETDKDLEKDMSKESANIKEETLDQEIKAISEKEKGDKEIQNDVSESENIKEEKLNKEIKDISDKEKGDKEIQNDVSENLKTTDNEKISENVSTPQNSGAAVENNQNNTIEDKSSDDKQTVEDGNGGESLEGVEKTEKAEQSEQVIDDKINNQKDKDDGVQESDKCSDKNVGGKDEGITEGKGNDTQTEGNENNSDSNVVEEGETNLETKDTDQIKDETVDVKDDNEKESTPESKLENKDSSVPKTNDEEIKSSEGEVKKENIDNKDDTNKECNEIKSEESVDTQIQAANEGEIQENKAEPPAP